MANLYIISGCNGAGKTTASYTVIPDLLHCREFVNADEIAKGISPFQPETVAIEAGRIMLKRIGDLLRLKFTFAFETTLASKSYVNLIHEAHLKGYEVTLVYFWLNAPELALERIKNRVESGGHNVAEETVIRRYYSGLANLSKLYLPICDDWMIIDNSEPPFKLVAEGSKNKFAEIYDREVYNKIIKP